MNGERRSDYITRDTILRLLSDDEVGRVSTAEATSDLTEGDEYVDLDEPDRGVRRLHDKATLAVGRVLPRKAVHEKTWRDIVILLSAHAIESAGAPHI